MNKLDHKCICKLRRMYSYSMHTTRWSIERHEGKLKNRIVPFVLDSWNFKTVQKKCSHRLRHIRTQRLRHRKRPWKYNIQTEKKCDISYGNFAKRMGSFQCENMRTLGITKEAAVGASEEQRTFLYPSFEVWDPFFWLEWECFELDMCNGRLFILRITAKLIYFSKLNDTKGRWFDFWLKNGHSKGWNNYFCNMYYL